MRGFRVFLLLAVAGTMLAGLGRQWMEQLARTPAVAKLTMPFRLAALAAEAPDPRILMPLHKVQVRQISTTWRADRPGGRKHEGQDIFAPHGTPVYSATRGIVIRVGDAGIGGNAVAVMGPGGRVYYYAHLSRFGGVAPGGVVNTETVLGYVGNTGNARATPPHLHFGIYGRSGAIDPLPLLSDRIARPAARQA